MTQHEESPVARAKVARDRAARMTPEEKAAAREGRLMADGRIIPKPKPKAKPKPAPKGRWLGDTWISQ